MKLIILKEILMVMVKFGENFKLKENLHIGLFGLLVPLKDGVKE
jgi:hypothetical protein